MITRLEVRNFKSIKQQVYEFTNFDLLVGCNNSGKSTVLQALSIWQFCVQEFLRAKRHGTTGKQVVLPNFTALPVPEFNLLWRERTDRRYPAVNGTKKQEFVYIEILVQWLNRDRQERAFGVKLRYNSPQSVYAIPVEGWEHLHILATEGSLPNIAYVPPFSGLEPFEEWRDDGPIRKQVGKAQPGSVLRNLLLRVCSPPHKGEGRAAEGQASPADWNEVKDVIQRWFSVELEKPRYEQGVDTQIVCEYTQGHEHYDIIASGSGFHQTLTLLAFLYGFRPSTILLDEPDAHLHVNLQREILDYFKRKAGERGIQFIIATHSEEMVKGVDARQVYSLLGPAPVRVESTPAVLSAMADVSNMEMAQLLSSPVMLYVEGESDERILRAWAPTCGAADVFTKLCVRVMGGGSKQQMKENADRHFNGVHQVVPLARRLMLFDYDTSETAFHPEPGNIALFEWHRRSIENYLLVPEAWERAVSQVLGSPLDDLFAGPARELIRAFFLSQNLSLPPRQNWRSVAAEVFRVINGKNLLFEGDHSLFQQLREGQPAVELPRETVAGCMVADEIHDDVCAFFARLQAMVQPGA